MFTRSMNDYGLDLTAVAVAVYLVTDDIRATLLISSVHALVHYVGFSMAKNYEQSNITYA